MCYKFGPRCPKSALSALRSARKAASKAVTDDAKLLAEERIIAATFEYYCTTEGLALLEQKIADGAGDTEYYATQLEQARQSREFRIALANNAEEVHIEKEDTMSHPNKFHDFTAMGAKERRAAGLCINLVKEDGLPDGAYIDSIATLEEFEQAYQDRLIEAIPHPDPNVPYVVLDYSREAQYSNTWNDITVNARGLIINRDTGEIVARPFRKFFNYNQPVEGLTDFDRSGPVVVTNKEDGSMGTLYTLPNGDPAISTRGSMNSEQAHRASEIFRERYAGQWEQNPDVTYVYEIIYPENRIVLDYGDKDDLVLIGGINRFTGRSIPLNEITEWKGERAEQYAYDSYADALASPISDDKEGVVVHFVDNDERVKIKGEKYLHLHKLVSNLTTRTMWEGASKNSDEMWLHELPDEFSEPARKYVTQLRSTHASRLAAVDNIVKDVAQKYGGIDVPAMTPDARKHLVMDLRKNYPKDMFSKVMMAVTGKRDRLEESIWQDLRPVGRKLIDTDSGEEE